MPIFLRNLRYKKNTTAKTAVVFFLYNLKRNLTIGLNKLLAYVYQLLTRYFLPLTLKSLSNYKNGIGIAYKKELSKTK